MNRFQHQNVMSFFTICTFSGTSLIQYVNCDSIKSESVVPSILI
uniref:Uncharacterized protein n=1 Tax=Anguilla anguilla TaxID=7936 RepID=A0A0E9TSM0_ANGAN